MRPIHRLLPTADYADLSAARFTSLAAWLASDVIRQQKGVAL
jgi:hypothetical protein